MFFRPIQTQLFPAEPAPQTRVGFTINLPKHSRVFLPTKPTQKPTSSFYFLLTFLSKCENSWN